MIKLGDRITVKPATFDGPGKDGKPKAIPGTVVYEQWARFKARLSGNEEVFDMDINEARKQLTSCADTGDTPSAWAKEAAEYCKRKGIFNGDGAGNFGWQQPITREAVACIIYRALEAAGALGNLSDV